MSQKKNVIIVLIDGGRLDAALKSTIFEKLGKDSVFFSQTITYSPHTIAAMHAVFSGCYGSRTGTNSYWSTFKFKKDKFKTLTEYLHDDSYYTHADVINELVIPKQGFDNFVIHDELNDDLSIRHKNLLNEMQNISNQGKNFFLYLHYSKIHTGIMNEVLKVYDNFSDEFFRNKTKNQERYDRLFEGAEDYLKIILNEIKNLGFNENSIILVMSDHGISVGEKIGERAYGSFCYDYTLKTFTFFCAKDFQPGTIKQQIRTVDFMPTILDYLKIPLNRNYNELNGVSILPLIYGESIPEFIAFSETGNPLEKKEPPKEPNTKSVRISKWKLIFNEHNGMKELYNLKLDPSEEINLIGKEEKIENMLWKELQELMSKE